MNREEQTYSTNTGEFIAEKLLPCPFCGGEPEFITIGNDYTKSRKAEIKCTKCFVKRTTGAIRNDLEWCGRKAIELWNKRTNGPSLPPAEGAEEILEGQLEILQEAGFKIPLKHGTIYNRIIDAMHEFATLHAQRIAEGAEEIEAELRGYARDIVRLHKPIMEVNPQLAMDSIGNDLVKMFNRLAQRIAEKMVEEKLKNAPKNCPKAAQCAHVEGGMKCPPNVICPI